MKLSRLAMIALASLTLWCATGPANAAEAADDEGHAKEGAKDIVMVGDAKCTSCHDEMDSPNVLRIGKTRHGVVADDRTPTCVGCHGISKKHEKEAGRGSGPTPPVDVGFTKKAKNTPEERSKVCLGCHEEGAARAHWAGSQHESRNIACTSCHKVHVNSDPILAKATQPEVCYTCHKTERAQHQRISTHPVAAGKMTCSDCHAAHGSTGPKLMIKNSVSETCFTCHAEKRGPFLWEHASAVDNCSNCHTPHGSTNTPLLKARAPWLCESCHNRGGHRSDLYSGAGLPRGAVANVDATTATNPLTGARIGQNNPQTPLAYRACANCHSQVHGSNHPAGQYFLR